MASRIAELESFVTDFAAHHFKDLACRRGCDPDNEPDGICDLEEVRAWQDEAKQITENSVAGGEPLSAPATTAQRDGDGPFPESEWHESDGDVLWWCWRDGKWLGEAPYVGTPLDLGYTVECHTDAKNGDTPAARFDVGGWPGYHTHWTRIPTPANPLEGE